MKDTSPWDASVAGLRTKLVDKMKTKMCWAANSEQRRWECPQWKLELTRRRDLDWDWCSSKPWSASCFCVLGFRTTECPDIPRKILARLAGTLFAVPASTSRIGEFKLHPTLSMGSNLPGYSSWTHNVPRVLLLKFHFSLEAARRFWKCDSTKDTSGFAIWYEFGSLKFLVQFSDTHLSWNDASKFYQLQDRSTNFWRVVRLTMSLRPKLTCVQVQVCLSCSCCRALWTLEIL